MLGSFTTDIHSIASIAYPTLVFIWILAALWARRRVKPKPVGEDAVLVRWGHPPRKGTVIAHCVYVASAAGNILLIIIALLAPKPVVTIGSATFLEGLSAILRPLMRWGTTIFAAMFAFIGILHARATYHDIKDFETAYSLAEEYDMLKAAKKGRVVLARVLAGN